MYCRWCRRNPLENEDLDESVKNYAEAIAQSGLKWSLKRYPIAFPWYYSGFDSGSDQLETCKLETLLENLGLKYVKIN